MDPAVCINGILGDGSSPAFWSGDGPPLSEPIESSILPSKRCENTEYKLYKSLSFNEKFVDCNTGAVLSAVVGVEMDGEVGISYLSCRLNSNPSPPLVDCRESAVL